jgi:hypothetical protein
MLFGTPSDTVDGQVTYNNETQALNLVTNSALRMLIDSSGRVTRPYQPFFRGALPAGYTINASDTTIGGTWSAVTNTGNHFNVSNGTFTAPVAGVYSIMLSIFFNQSAAYRQDAYILINGVATARTEQQKWSEASRNNTVNVCAMIDLSAGDTISFGAMSNVATSTYVVSLPWSYACIYLL